MSDSLVDYSFLEKLSGGEPKYKYDVLEIFLNTMDEGMDNLSKLVEASTDYEAIFKQAHALKSSAGIVQVQDMHANLSRIEELGRNIYERGTKTGQEEIKTLFSQTMDTYQKARPGIVDTMNKNKPA